MRTAVAALALGLAANSALADPAETLGLTSADYPDVVVAVLEQVVPRNVHCGSAMTEAACAETRDAFARILREEIDIFRDVHVARIAAVEGDLEAAVRAWKAQPGEMRAAPLCREPELAVRCSALVDTLMFGAPLVPLLDRARAEAATRVDAFYADGRPFEPRTE